MFRSWIPTVTGQLSFSVIGRTDWPERCIFASKIDADFCKAVYVQERFTHDFLLPFVGLSDRYINWIYDRLYLVGARQRSGRHFYFCIVDEPIHKDELDLTGLSGKIYAVPFRSEIKPTINRALTRIVGCRNPEGLHQTLSEVRLDIAGTYLVEADFKLLRTGEFSLLPRANKDAIDFEPLTEADIHRYAAQMFYFMRDIAHNHQHHDGGSDLIVRLHRDSDSWAKNVYYDLYRNIIHFKRLRTDFHVTNASGLVAYSETFRELFLSKDTTPYKIENTLLSLETAKYELQVKKSEKSNKIALTQTFAFGFLGALLTITSLAQFAAPELRQKIEVSDTVLFLSKWFIERTGTSIVVVVFFSTLLMKLWGISPPERKRGFKSALRTFQGFERGGHVLVYVAMGILAGGLGLYLAMS